MHDVQECECCQTSHYNAKKVVRVGKVVVLDEQNPHFRNIRDGTTIMLDANSGVYTMDSVGLHRWDGSSFQLAGTVSGHEPVRAGPMNRPRQKEREEHEATHVPFRDWCTHCMMGKGPTHHHITKQTSEDEPRRPTIAMDNNFMTMKSVVNAR